MRLELMRQPTRCQCSRETHSFFVPREKNVRFGPANISLINRRLYLPRLLLTLSSKTQRQNHPSHSKMLTGSHHINVRFADNTSQTPFPPMALTNSAWFTL